jgi:peptide/nickel transport system substrate-binding protein
MDINEQILSALGQYPASDSDVNYDARFDRLSRFDLKSTNPIMITSTAEFEYSGLTGIGLLGFDWRFQMFASSDTVVSWHSSADRMYDKIVLRDDLTWTDGKPVTAHDVEFSFQTIMNPKVPVPAVRTGTDQLKWVKAYDDHTVVFFHKEALATNAFNIAFPILPKHVYEESLADDATLQNSDYHVKLERQPVTGGPYRLKSRIVGQEFVLERRDDWSIVNGEQVRRKPYFKEIRFRVIEDANTALLAVKNGDVHDCELNPEQWVTQTTGDDFYNLNTKATGEEWAFSYISWNCQTPYFSDKRVRQAMAYALDHKEMMEEICYGIYQPCTGIYHPTAWMAPQPSPEPYQQDLDKAEQLLDEAGWTDSDGDGIRDKEIDGEKVDFEFSLILGEGSPTGERIAVLLSENLSQIGIECRPQPMEFTVMQQRARDHEFQAMMAGWGTGVDPESGENLWTTKALKEQGRNYSAYTNPEVDELFERGKREFDRAERAKIYARIHTILWEDQPYLWLYYRNAFFAFDKDLRGYAFSPRGPYTYGPGFDSIWMTAE